MVTWRDAAVWLSGVLSVWCGGSLHVSAQSEPADSMMMLEGLVVTGQSARQRISGVQLGAERLELTKLSLTPALFGENDLIKSITLLPGVHGEGEGAGGFEVRGGTAAQNLVTIDGATLYNPSHVMGIFSTFNDDAIGSATLYKGPLPAAYGGAVSSVLDVGLAPGSMTDYHASGTIGLLAAKINAEGPVVKEKLSVAVAARRSYVDMFLKMVPEYRDIVMNFYDVTAKVRYNPCPGNYVDVSFFASRDNEAISKLMSMRWGNVAASANWSSRSGDVWRFVTTAGFTNYTADMGMDIMNADRTLDEYIRNFSLNERVTLSLGEKHELEWGIRSELLRVKSAEWAMGPVREREVRSGWQNALWMAYSGSFGEHVSLSAGMRLSAFSALTGKRFEDFVAIGGGESPESGRHTYVDPEPRVSVKYSVDGHHNIKAGASVATQNLHAIRSSSTSFPFDRYALTSASVRPERAVQYGLGYAGMTEDGGWDWSAEVYYKDLKNVYDYIDGRGMFSDIDLESITLGGKGRGCGAEFMVRKNSGRLTGWVSYTWSRTRTRIPGINSGRWYDASNDRRHHLSVVAMFRINDRWNLSGSWTYSSGQALTAPDVKYELDGATCYYYSGRNGYRTPASHRLDLSAVYTRRGKRFTGQWAFGIYNAYNYYSPYIIYFEDDDTRPSGSRAVQRSLYGIVPSVSYTLKF